MDSIRLKPIFHLANLFERTDRKVGSLPTCSRRIFSPANFNLSRCWILFSLRVARTKSLKPSQMVSCCLSTQAVKQVSRIDQMETSSQALKKVSLIDRIDQM